MDETWGKTAEKYSNRFVWKLSQVDDILYWHPGKMGDTAKMGEFCYDEFIACHILHRITVSHHLREGHCTASCLLMTEIRDFRTLTNRHLRPYHQLR